MKKEVPTVAVLMATYNGEKFLKEQIDSILSQKNIKVKLIVRDDGSMDDTLNILKSYERKGELIYSGGDNIGPAKNFFSLLKECPYCDYYAFSDQDDIWDSDKLEVAVNALSDYSIPVIYHCAVRKVDEYNDFLKNVIKRKPVDKFSSALIKSDLQGSTAVINNEMKNEIVKYDPDFVKLGVLHDAWLHKICLAIEGKIIYDTKPHMSYRIHNRNVVANYNSQNRITKKIKRYFVYSRKNYCEQIANEILKGYSNEMSVNNRYCATVLANYRKKTKYKIILLFTGLIRSNNWKKDIGFWINVLLNKA